MNLGGYFSSSYMCEKPWPYATGRRYTRADMEREVAGILADAARAGGPDEDLDDVDEGLRSGVHESGHALTLWLLGESIASVSIDRDHGGTVRMGSAELGRDAELLVLFAGGAAERAVLGDVDPHGCSDDEERAAELYAGRPGLVGQLRQQAAEIAQQGADAIMWLSVALRARGTLPGAEAVAILAEHYVAGPSERAAEVRAAAPAVGTPRGTITLSARGVRIIDGNPVPYTFEYAVAAERAYLWPPAAIEAFNAMNAAGDRDDWEAYRRHQDRLADIQRPLLLRGRAA